MLCVPTIIFIVIAIFTSQNNNLPYNIGWIAVSELLCMIGLSNVAYVLLAVRAIGIVGVFGLSTYLSRLGRTTE